MNNEIKAKWLEALRSGKYKQGRAKLRDMNNHFCCLGVLCDIMKPNSWNINTRREIYTHLGTGYLPDTDLMNSIGIESFDKLKSPEANVLYKRYKYNSDNEIPSLVALNDSGATFAEIADIIEKEL